MSKRYVNSAFYVMYIETNQTDQCTVIEDGEYNLIAVIPLRRIQKELSWSERHG